MIITSTLLEKVEIEGNRTRNNIFFAKEYCKANEYSITEELHQGGGFQIIASKIINTHKKKIEDEKKKDEDLDD